MPRTAYLPCLNQFADVAAGDRLSTDQHDRIAGHLKAKLMAKIFETAGITFSTVAKMEILAFMHFTGMQLACQDHAGEISGRGHGKIASKWNGEQNVQAGLGQQRFFDRLRRNQFRRDVRPQNAQRMGIKGEHYGCATRNAGPLHYLSKNMPMTAMDAIKISDGHNGWAKIRNCFQGMEYPHAISNSSFSPSCANFTCPGRLRLVSSCGRSCEI